MSGEEGNVFGESGVIPGAGGLGNREQEWVEKIMKNPENGQMLMYYGITALVTAVLNLLIYLIWGHRNWVVGPASKWWFWIHELIWWPVGILWLALAFYDATWLRTIFSGIVQWSFLGPFAGYWAAIVYMMVEANKTYLSNGKKGWNYWGFWVVWSFYIAYTVFAMIIQVGMVPKIFDWIENAPINENLPKEKPAEETSAADETMDMETDTTVTADDELWNNSAFDF